MNKISVVQTYLEKYGEIKLERCKGLYYKNHESACSEIMSEFCPSDFGLENNEKCEQGFECDCIDCWCENIAKVEEIEEDESANEDENAVKNFTWIKDKGKILNVCGKCCKDCTGRKVCNDHCCSEKTVLAIGDFDCDDKCIM